MALPPWVPCCIKSELPLFRVSVAHRNCLTTVRLDTGRQQVEIGTCAEEPGSCALLSDSNNKGRTSLPEPGTGLLGAACSCLSPLPASPPLHTGDRPLPSLGDAPVLAPEVQLPFLVTRPQDSAWLPRRQWTSPEPSQPLLTRAWSCRMPASALSALLVAWRPEA
ncbi:hypothetical protein NDU88_006425 [Pleurodeles waltl]|uniref:Uncharacterized protein n=1 Tax=Pleurodeles waltl TaxID=8319 RepID=A0AAV7TYD0_PLEWA|nr:hypothetical protein NDU88_006425 [Pleurodeles waltl]